MTDQPNPMHDDDAEGHKASFVVDVPHASSEEDDDAEGHVSGAVRIDPGVPSAIPDPNVLHPKSH